MGLGCFRWSYLSWSWNSSVGRLALVWLLVPGSVSWNFTDSPRMVVRDVCDRHSKLAVVRRNTPGGIIVHFGPRLCFLSSAINPTSRARSERGGRKMPDILG